MDSKQLQHVSDYTMIRKISEGGMGAVYEAVQSGASGFTKTVAIKTIVPRLCEHQRIVDMFISEAKLVANLVHENIVQIYQLGQDMDGYYIVMEYVNGLSLYDFIRFHVVINQPIPTDLAVFIVSRIARGLAYAHNRKDRQGKPLNIVHRDVCPNNILITTEGLPKLTDFGIAKAAGTIRAETQSGLMGKLTYMSPEQAQRSDVNFQADHFALGACLFELLTGNAIRSSKGQADLLEMAKSGHVEWSLIDKKRVPKDVIKILKRCLATKPQKRYDDTNELARELEYFIYKDGYGPTIQTLEAYLKQQFPYLYQQGARTLSIGDGPTTAEMTTADSTLMNEIDQTMVMDDAPKRSE